MLGSQCEQMGLSYGLRKCVERLTVPLHQKTSPDRQTASNSWATSHKPCRQMIGPLMSQFWKEKGFVKRGSIKLW